MDKKLVALLVDDLDKWIEKLKALEHRCQL